MITNPIQTRQPRPAPLDPDDIRAELEAYRSIVVRYQQCKSFYDDLMPSLVSHLSDMPRGGQFAPQQENNIEQRISMQSIMSSSLRQMQERIRSIERLIDKAPDERSKTILALRYMYGKNLADTADLVGVQQRMIKLITADSIKHIAQNNCP